MEQQILDLITNYAHDSEDSAPNERVLNDIHHFIPSFQSLIDNHSYIMKPSIDDENTLTVQFSSKDGQIYTTYTFCNVLVPVKK